MRATEDEIKQAARETGRIVATAAYDVSGARFAARVTDLSEVGLLQLVMSRPGPEGNILSLSRYVSIDGLQWGNRPPRARLTAEWRALARSLFNATEIANDAPERLHRIVTLTESGS